MTNCFFFFFFDKTNDSDMSRQNVIKQFYPNYEDFNLKQINHSLKLLIKTLNTTV